MANKINTSRFGLLITGVFASALYFLMEVVDPRGISLSAWMNIGVLLSVSILAQVLINRAEIAKEALAMINQTLEEKVKERTTAIEEANRLLNEEVAIRTLTEEFLRESEEKYRAIFENTGAATIIINEDKTIALANNEFQNLSGYSIDEVTGARYWTDFFTKEAVQSILEFHRASLNDPGAKLKNHECLFLDRNNTEKRVLVTVARIPGADQSLASISEISPASRPDRPAASVAAAAAAPSSGDEEAALREAVERHGILAYYQPVIRCATKKIVGFEALARWKHPQRGVLEAEVFLGRAGKMGILADLDRAVLAQACAQIKKWQDVARTAEPLTMTANVSKSLLLAPGFDKELADLLAEYGLQPQTLFLDVRRDDLTSDGTDVRAAMEKVARVGVRINLDGCLTTMPGGVSWKDLPFDGVKIGPALAGRLSEDGDGTYQAMKKIAAEALEMGKQVLAVGVETVGQHVLVSNLNCQLAQGFLYGKPMERQIIDRVIEGRKKAAAR